MNLRSSGPTTQDELETAASWQGYAPEKVAEATQAEQASLSAFGVHEEVSASLVPKTAKIIGTTVVLKRNDTGKMKARVCAQYFKYCGAREDTYAPTPSTSSLRLVLVLAALKGLKVRTGDFTTAFLHAELMT